MLSHLEIPNSCKRKGNFYHRIFKIQVSLENLRLLLSLWKTCHHLVREKRSPKSSYYSAIFFFSHLSIYTWFSAIAHFKFRSQMNLSCPHCVFSIDCVKLESPPSSQTKINLPLLLLSLWQPFWYLLLLIKGFSTIVHFELRSQVNLLIVTFPKTVHDCVRNSTI